MNCMSIRVIRALCVMWCMYDLVYVCVHGLAGGMVVLWSCSHMQGPVMFKVQVPNFPDRSEWKLHGQVLSFTLPITDPVSSFVALY